MGIETCLRSNLHTVYNGHYVMYKSYMYRLHANEINDRMLSLYL